MPPPRRHARAQQEVREALGEERYLALCHQGAGYPLADIVQLASWLRARP